jgi:phage terminase large subunit-like protein
LEIHEKLNQWVKYNPLYFFTPTGKQEEFIKVIGEGKHFVCILSAANAIGKTALMANILGGFIFGSNENPYLDYPLFNNFPYPHRARIASTPKNIEEIGAIQTEIKKWWPVGKYEAKKNKKSYDSEYIKDDWIIDIMSYEQDESEFESATLGVAIFDEPPPMRILNATIARMRMGGIILIFMTPLDTGGEVIENLTEKEIIEIEGEPIGKVALIYAEIEDACIEHGVRGFLEHKHIAQMLSFYDDEERLAREKGKPVTYSGRIYPSFSQNVHVIPFEDAPVDNIVLYHILDPHDRKPWAMQWIILHSTGTTYCIDEYPNRDFNKNLMDNKAYDEYANIIKEKEDALFDIYGKQVYKRIIDPNFGNKTIRLAEKVDERAHTTPKEELRKRGFIFQDGLDSLEAGHLKVREKLHYEVKDGEIVIQPKFFVTDNCFNTIRHFLRYTLKDILTSDGDVRDSVKPKEKYKDFCDLTRYFWMSNPRYFEGLKDFIPEKQKVY